MSTSPLSPEDIRAAAEVYHELGPEYRDAVVASFIDQVDREVAARVDARLAGTAQAVPAKRDSRRMLVKGIAIGACAAALVVVAVAGRAGGTAPAHQARVPQVWVKPAAGPPAPPVPRPPGGSSAQLPAGG